MHKCNLKLFWDDLSFEKYYYPSSYPAFAQIRSCDIIKFLKQVAVLLRHFIVESSTHLHLPTKAKVLKDHIDKIQDKKTKRTTILLNVVNNLLLYSARLASKKNI